MSEKSGVAAPAPVTARLASWVAGVSLADMPEEVRTRAKHLLLDGIGCGLVGAGLEWSRSATATLRALEGDGPAALIGTGQSTAPSAAALLNSSYVQGFELDDYHPEAPLHTAMRPTTTSSSAVRAFGRSR